MNSVRFIINNRDADYLKTEDFNVAIYRKILNYSNLTQKTGSFTRTVKLPLTPKNESIFGIVSRTDDSRNIDISRPCEIEVNGITALRGTANVMEVDLVNRTISISIIGSEIEWAKKIGNDTLHSIDLGTYSMNGALSTYEYNRLYDTLSNADYWAQYPFAHALVIYGNPFLPNKWQSGTLSSTTYYKDSTADTGGGVNPVPLGTREIFEIDEYYLDRRSNPHYLLADFAPCVNLVRAIRACFAKAGIAVSGKWLADPEVNQMVLLANNQNWNWAYLAQGRFLDAIKTGITTAQFTLNPVDGYKIEFGNSLDYRLFYTFFNAGQQIRTQRAVQFLGAYDNSGRNASLFLYYYLPSIAAIETQPPPFIYTGGDKTLRITDTNTAFGIISNRAFAVNARGDVYIDYTVPIAGKYRIQTQMYLDYILYLLPYLGFPPPNVLSAGLLAVQKRIALIVRKVSGDKQLDDFGIIAFGYNTPLGDADYIGHELHRTLAPFANYNIVINGNYEVELNKGERIQVYVVFPMVGDEANWQISGYNQINSIQVNMTCDYLEPLANADITQQVRTKMSAQTMYPELFLENLKITDFLKDIFTLFNVQVGYSPANNTVTIDSYDNFYLPAAYAVDISANCRYGIKRSPKEGASVEQLIFSYEIDDDDDALDITQQRSLLTIGTGKAQEIKTSFISQTAVGAFNFGFALEPYSFVNQQFTQGFTVLMPLVGTREVLATPQNGVPEFPENYNQRLMKLAPDVQYLNQSNRFQMNLIDYITSPNDDPNAGIAVRVWDSVNNCERIMMDYLGNKVRYDLWNHVLNLVTAPELLWTGSNGLYQKYWVTVTNRVQNGWEYEIEVQMDMALYTKLSTSQMPVIIDGDVFVLNEINGFSLLAPNLAKCKFLKVI